MGTEFSALDENADGYLDVEEFRARGSGTTPGSDNRSSNGLPSPESPGRSKTDPNPPQSDQPKTAPPRS
jgi:hypothetical protein